jgi:sugar lactone lactonase YvrE
MQNPLKSGPLSLLLLALTAAGSAFAQYTIQTVAGAGKLPVPGEGISATAVRLVQPAAISSDGAGTAFIVDNYFQAVLRVDRDGSVLRYVGTGEDGFSGDDGPAWEARLRNPAGVLATPSGELYIADASNGRVRKVDAAGIITTFAGGGPLARSGDGGPALSAGIGNPNTLAMDAQGNLYFSDTFNHIVRKVSAADGTISTVAGSAVLGFAGDNGPATEARLQRPTGIAVDRAGNLYIADTQNNRIRRVAAATGIITTIAGSSQAGFNGDNGPAVNAILNAPTSVAVAADGTIYLADTSNGRVRQIRNGTITTVAGGGGNTSVEPVAATRASLGAVNALTLDGLGNLLIAESGFKRLRTMSLEDGMLRLFAGAAWVDSPGDGAEATSAILVSPVGVAVGGDGTVFIADQIDHRVRAVDPNGVISTYAGNGNLTNSGDGEAAISVPVGQPSGLAIDSLGYLYVSTPSRIRRVAPLSDGGGITTYAGGATTGFGGDEGPAVSARLFFPQGLAFDAEDNLYIADTTNHRIRKVIRSTGVIVTVAGTGTAGFSGDDGPAIRATLSSPRGVAVDRDGNVYIADSSNNRIRKVDTSGIITTIVGTGVVGFSPDGTAAAETRINTPIGILFDLSGNLVFSHGGSGRIQRIRVDTGTVENIAGRAAIGFSGDGGAASDALLNFPNQLAITPDGKIFVADRLNYRVRVLTPEAPPE